MVKAFDRRGTLVADFAWTAAGALEDAWLRIPDGSWLAIEPRATADAPWGLSDRLWRAPTHRSGARTPLTIFEALDWARVDRVPTMAEPARLPPGGGTAVLNLIATLARAQGAAPLAYRGPYPTEQLFAALLESFRYLSDAPDPLSAFMAGGVEWSPAPHEPFFSGEGVYVQLRDRVEKVVFRGATYLRPDWQGVARHAGKRVRDAPEGVLCSLWALGRPLEDHLLLSNEGDLVRVLEPEPAAGESRPMPREVARGVAAVIAATSAPPLGPFIMADAEMLTLEWGAPLRELVAVEPRRVRVSLRVRELLVELLAAARGRGDRAALALAALVEVAALTGDALRARAQAAVAALPADAQAAALAAGAAAPRDDPGRAREIVRAVEALLDDLGA